MPKKLNTLSHQPHFFPVILIEGLDGVGKSTTIKLLSKRINAIALKSPPKLKYYAPRMATAPRIKFVWNLLRPLFDRCNEANKRQFYDFGNLVVSEIIAATRSTMPIVLDRYWQSTVAAKLAWSNVVLPKKGSAVYCRPRHLIKESHGFFLMLNETERARRCKSRKIGLTTEERRLAEDDAFRERMLTVYRNTGLNFISIDGLAPLSVVDKIITLITRKNGGLMNAIARNRL